MIHIHVKENIWDSSISVLNYTILHLIFAHSRKEKRLCIIVFVTFVPAIDIFSCQYFSFIIVKGVYTS